MDSTKWINFCKPLFECKQKRTNEQEFQNKLDSLFRYYLEWVDNIIREECLPVGSVGSIRPDFVLYKDGAPVLTIEAKEPNHIQTERNREQLFSYMRQKKVDFGLYVGEMIQLYYDIPSDNEPPVLILEFEYNPDSDCGRELFELLEYPAFDKDALRKYCEESINHKKRMEILDAEIQKLVEDCDEILIKILRSHYLANGFTDSDIDYITSHIDISFKTKNLVPDAPVTPYDVQEERIHMNAGSRKKRSKSKYSINGEGEYCKNRASLEFVKLYLKDHPSNYQAVNALFNGSVPHFLVLQEEVKSSISTSSDKDISKRWFLENPLRSLDGKVFYVSTQIGDGCQTDFQQIRALAERLGYTIAEL